VATRFKSAGQALVLSTLCRSVGQSIAPAGWFGVFQELVWCHDFERNKKLLIMKELVSIT
jgi:hypothetical protein